ncbi:MAG: glycosyltransferase family 4 protein [Spirochaetes bacterium]|nr:glycosyltransferase family 4 protein [Spirochaetota bacterium]
MAIKFLKKQGIYISIKPHAHAAGGGSNTFAWNFCRHLEKFKIPRVKCLLFAKHALIIASRINFFLLWLAKKTDCFIVHRLDEHFQKNESIQRKKKHDNIVKINRIVDFTVFQSEFVKKNVLPYLDTKNCTVIINGADPKIFYNQRNKKRQYIGHVTNSVGDKKRLDLLEKIVIRYPNELFLFVGNHRKASIDFSRYPNVTMVGTVNSQELVNYYNQMKCLYFPSENDPCPNTVVEAILSGTPVCYNPKGGTVEIVRDCGYPLDKFGVMLKNLSELYKNCKKRKDLYFERAMKQYLDLFKQEEY